MVDEEEINISHGQVEAQNLGGGTKRGQAAEAEKPIDIKS
jgi:hypothetical protein